jgi:hydroxymethylbilane synthase
VTYTTVGDRVLDRPLSAIGAKGLFTKELEDDLLAGRIDCAVHSLKDLPTENPLGLEIAAMLEREDARDALVLPTSGAHPAGAHGTSAFLALAPGSRVGTSSLRRRAQLRAVRPDLEVVELRGNVPTRVRKVDDGEVDAAILAAAGLHRLGLHARVSAYLDAPGWLSAPGQGAIAVQARAGDRAMRAMLERIHHAPTARMVAAERALLATLEGGCQVPIGAIMLYEDSQPTLHGLVADVHGKQVVRGSIVVDEIDPASSGRALAERLRADGGAEILEALRAMVGVPAPQPE